jgi:hypothetical protein
MVPQEECRRCRSLQRCIEVRTDEVAGLRLCYEALKASNDILRVTLAEALADLKTLREELAELRLREMQETARRASR